MDEIERYRRDEVRSATVKMPHPRPGPKWFEPTYEQREQRTVELTQVAIDALIKAGKRVSMSAIPAMSLKIDSTEHGISESAILRSAEARLLYVSARAWRAPISRQRRQEVKRNPFTLPVKLGRRVQDSRRRLPRPSKSELIERLLEFQNAYAVVRAAWLQASAGKLAKKLSRK
jgi:hypothetical protein